MNKHFSPIITFTICLFFSGCTTIVDTTTSKSIETDPAERSFGTYLDDKKIEVVIGVNINKASPDLKSADVTVTSFHNVVLLTGQVPKEELKQLAETTASSVIGVKKVYNELQIKGNSALLVRTNDTWLATKVKSVFIADKLIDSSKVKIVVEDSVIYLMGIATQSEADYITDITSNIAGIQEVVKVFEYIKE
jgi:osmotically-inducible protein OsmY